jgi:hypothetical protein
LYMFQASWCVVHGAVGVCESRTVPAMAKNKMTESGAGLMVWWWQQGRRLLLSELR